MTHHDDKLKPLNAHCNLTTGQSVGVWSTTIGHVWVNWHLVFRLMSIIHRCHGNAYEVSTYLLWCDLDHSSCPPSSTTLLYQWDGLFLRYMSLAAWAPSDFLALPDPIWSAMNDNIMITVYQAHQVVNYSAVSLIEYRCLQCQQHSGHDQSSHHFS